MESRPGFFRGSLTLPETTVAPENGWFEYDRFLLGNPFFRGENVSFSQGTQFLKKGLNLS